MLQFIGVVLLVIWIGVFVYFIYSYNSLIAKKNLIDQAFSSVDVLLKKRSDMIPNLVSIVQQYMQFEQSILVEITRLRSQIVSGKLNKNGQTHLENQMTKALQHLFVKAESFPILKTNDHFINLQYSLNEIEEQISAARRFYNSAVVNYNNGLEMFPTNIIALAMNYKKRRVFVAKENDRENIDIKNLFQQK